MLPRFDDKLSIVGTNKTSVRAEGPYPLAGNERDAYFWLRISQKQGDREIDAVGKLSIEQEDLEKEFAAATTRFENAVAAAVNGTRSLSAPQLGQKLGAIAVEASASTGPRWGVTLRGDQRFRNGAATAEAWLLIRTTDNPPRETQTYWKTKVRLTGA
jgi:hypothetical protein